MFSGHSVFVKCLWDPRRRHLQQSVLPWPYSDFAGIFPAAAYTLNSTEQLLLFARSLPLLCFLCLKKTSETPHLQTPCGPAPGHASELSTVCTSWQWKAEACSQTDILIRTDSLSGPRVWLLYTLTMAVIPTSTARTEWSPKQNAYAVVVQQALTKMLIPHPIQHLPIGPSVHNLTKHTEHRIHCC